MTENQPPSPPSGPVGPDAPGAKSAPHAGKATAQLDPFHAEMEALIRGESGDPHHILGPHYVGDAAKRQVVVRAFIPRSSRVTLILDAAPEAPITAERIHPAGIYAATLPGERELPLAPDSYRWRVREQGFPDREFRDPYAFAPLLTEFDLHLFGEGTHTEAYEKLGAHVIEFQGVAGVSFGVWAPNAQRVSVVGDFNQWDGRTHPMRSRGSSGLWELFIPGLAEGAIYKYELRTRQGGLPFLKADPYGFRAELRPRTGSIVARLDKHKWNDAAWIAERAKHNWLASPITIYELHLGSWRRNLEHNNRWLTYSETADQLIPYLQQMGFTHIELMPVMEHPFDGSWGYQTVGYFAPTSRYGTPDDFMQFVDRLHQAGIGVLLDWTPAHFPRDAHGLAEFDGTHLYEHADPRQGTQPDWGTLVFNYGRTEVQNFLIANALFWMDKYHIDGLRVDAVASMLYLDYSRRPGEWIPNEFGGRENLGAIALLKRLSEAVHGRFPGTLSIAEESTAWPAVSRPTYLGGLGFDLKWNMGWMNDTLKYFSLDPIYRKFQHNRMTFSMLYAFTENFVLPLSHDEVVHGKASLLHKMPGDNWQQFANLRLLFGYMYAHPGKKLLFMGGEFAQREEWNHDASLDWNLLDYAPHQGVQRLVADLNALCKREPALHQIDFEWQGFEWLDCTDAEDSVLSFVRRSRDDDKNLLIVVANFTPVVRENYRVGVPEPGLYREILNTDSAAYGGSNVGNLGGAQSEPLPWSNLPNSLNLRLPPLAVTIFKLDRS